MNFKNLITIIMVLLCISVPTFAAEQRMYVTADYLNVRSTPSAVSDTNIVKSVAFRNYVTKIGESGDWTQIRMADGRTAYMKSSYLSTTQPAIKPLVSKTTSSDGQGSLIGYYQLTAYCSCRACCGSWSGGPTASGAYPKAGTTVACNSIPLGTKVMINGHQYIVQDTGGMGNNVVDIYFNSHSEALKFGRKYNVPVYRVN